MRRRVPSRTCPRPGSQEARDGLREALRIERIPTSVHYPPIHRFTSYAGAGSLPVTEEIADRWS